MKKVAACFLIMAFVFTGCTGSFKVTKAVYHFHREQKEKIVDELLFLGCVILPVYGIAMLADGIVLNTIEFWTGRNPMTSTGDSRNTIAQNGQERVIMKYDANKGTVEVNPVANNGKALIFSRTDDGVVAMDRSGKVLYTSVEDAHGGVTVFDANHQVVRYFTPETVDKGRVKLFQN
jgi:hypothetical protein